MDYQERMEGRQKTIDDPEAVHIIVSESNGQLALAVTGPDGIGGTGRDLAVSVMLKAFEAFFAGLGAEALTPSLDEQFAQGDRLN